MARYRSVMNLLPSRTVAFFDCYSICCMFKNVFVTRLDVIAFIYFTNKQTLCLNFQPLVMKQHKHAKQCIITTLAQKYKGRRLEKKLFNLQHMFFQLI